MARCRPCSCGAWRMSRGSYDRGYGHFTTRQNIQFNWIKLADLPDALADLAEVGIHAMQTSGNCTRNVTADQWAGVAPGEVEDPRIWAELLRQYSTLHPEFSFLPRKFKFAITASAHDRAAIKMHDIGLRCTRTRKARPALKCWSAAGSAARRSSARRSRGFMPGRDLLSYVEAILRVYNQLRPPRQYLQGADQDPRPRTRHREVRRRSRGRVGDDARHRPASSTTRSWPIFVVASRIRPTRSLPHMPDELRKAAHDPRFEAWRKNSVAPHREPAIPS